MKVFVSPHPDTAPHGLQRVMKALYRHLPDCDAVGLVDSPEQADIVNVHSMAFVDTDKPIMYTSHGLHWGELPWPPDYLKANQMMINYMKRSQAITAVSDWVAHSLSRGMLKRPYVINNGVDVADWQHEKECLGYVLWNKARADLVCRPDELNRIAAMMPEVGFVSTLGEKAANVQITGVVPHDQMKDMVQRAGVYLSLARETAGIGTLEALASGVPVVGWDWGGNRDYIEHNVNGYLVPHGNYEQLAISIQAALTYRDILSKNALESVKKWDWANLVPKYADALRETWGKYRNWRVKVTVLITAHNLDKYLVDCLQSVLKQDMDDWECLIVDDCSTDSTAAIAQEFCQKDGRFKYLHTGTNLKLSGARNFGINRASGRYILPLDADDMLTPSALSILSEALDHNPHIHIAYGHLHTINEDGSGERVNPWPPDQFNWFEQIAHLNQLPYSSMMRSEILRISGAYRIRDYLAEDAAMWVRLTSLGYRAEKVTGKATLLYRLRPDSKSTTDRREYGGHGGFTQWFGWKTADDPINGMKNIQQGIKPIPALVPFGAQGGAENWCWPVWSHHDPTVSVIIPVGPKHEGFLVDALDSLIAQTFPFWEAVVINDTGKPLNLDYAPWARVCENGRHNIASSRNIGIENARAPLLLFLDADDFLFPSALEQMLKAFAANGGARYIYTDWYNVTPDRPPTKNSAVAYNRQKTDGSQHPVSALVRKEHAVAVGGFSEDLPGWEDWEFYIKMAVAGFCGEALSEPLLVYRLHSGGRREESIQIAENTLSILRQKYEKYYNGTEQMKMCCDGDTGAVFLIKQQLGLIPKDQPIISRNGGSNQMSTVRIEYIGSKVGATTFARVGNVVINPPVRAGNNPIDKYHDVSPEVAQALRGTGFFKVVNAESVDLNQAVVQPTRPDSLAGMIQQPVVSTAIDTAVSGDQPSFMKPKPPNPQETAFVTAQIPAGQDFDPTTMTVGEVKKAAVGCTVEQLQSALEREKSGSNRVTAVDFLEMMIADSQRLLETGE